MSSGAGVTLVVTWINCYFLIGTHPIYNIEIITLTYLAGLSEEVQQDDLYAVFWTLKLQFLLVNLFLLFSGWMRTVTPLFLLCSERLGFQAANSDWKELLQFMVGSHPTSTDLSAWERSDVLNNFHPARWQGCCCVNLPNYITYWTSQLNVPGWQSQTIYAYWVSNGQGQRK